MEHLCDPSQNIAAELHLLLYQVGHDHKQYMGHGNTMLEVYTPGDMQAPDYECGIWVPIVAQETRNKV